MLLTLSTADVVFLVTITALLLLFISIVSGNFPQTGLWYKDPFDLDLLELIQTFGIIGALSFSIYSLFQSHRFAKERIKLEKIFEQKIASYTELYSIIVELRKILLPEKILKGGDRAIAVALLETDRRMYTTLVKRLYPFVLEGKDIYLSRDLEEKVQRIILPIYKRESLYGNEVQKEIEDRNRLTQALADYQKEITSAEIFEILKEIDRSIPQDLGLERVSKEFA